MARDRLTARHWFLPRAPDLLGLLRTQAQITAEGVQALADWAHGEQAAASRVRECEHRADERKRELRVALGEAFATPLEPEDLFELSQSMDGVLNRAKDTVREAEVLGAAPDAAIADMADELAAGTLSLAKAFDALAPRGDRGAATQAADEAIRSQRRVEHIYRVAMPTLIGAADPREVATKRELYRRLVRTSDHLATVAERVWYAVLKTS